jgi:hypothetical protein
MLSLPNVFRQRNFPTPMSGNESFLVRLPHETVSEGSHRSPVIDYNRNRKQSRRVFGYAKCAGKG